MVQIGIIIVILIIITCISFQDQVIIGQLFFQKSTPSLRFDVNNFNSLELDSQNYSKSELDSKNENFFIACISGELYFDSLFGCKLLVRMCTANYRKFKFFKTGVSPPILCNFI